MKRGAARGRTAAALAAAAILGHGFAAASPAAATKRAPAAAPLSVEEVIANNVAARGGLAAWRKIRTMTWIGYIESAHAPVPGMPFTLEQERPNKTRFEINLMGSRTVRVFDGTQGWELRIAADGTAGVQPFTAEALAFAAQSSGLDGPLIGYRAKGNLVTLDGVDRIGGRAAYRIGIKLPSGERDLIWVDARTFLDVRYDRSTVGRNGKPVTVTTVYRDFKNYAGLRMPAQIETRAGRTENPDSLMIQRVSLNPRLPDADFGMPRGSPPPGRVPR